jgi:hypothetical protein
MLCLAKYLLVNLDAGAVMSHVIVVVVVFLWVATNRKRSKIALKFEIQNDESYRYSNSMVK